jgi:hypothetical protein
VASFAHRGNNDPHEVKIAALKPRNYVEINQTSTTRRQGFGYAASAEALFTVAACIAVVRTNIEMKEPTPDIRPATLALKQLSKTRPVRPMPRYHGTHHSILLLPGPDSVAPPSAALFDTVLQPVDKVVYLVAMTIACRCNDDAYLPPQAELARMANVSSTDTVWRALSILRCGGWSRARKNAAEEIDTNRASTWSMRHHCP